MIWSHFLFPAAPILTLVLSAITLLTIETVAGGKSAKFLKVLIALLGPLLSVLATWTLLRVWPIDLLGLNPGQADSWLIEFGKFYRLDPLSLGLFWGIGIFSLLSVVFWESYFDDEDLRTEVYILLHFIAVGMMLLVSANNLLMVFLGLELLSLPTYVLVGFRRSDIGSSEAAMKYFLYGAFATVLIVFGMALLYAETATLSLPLIQDLVAQKRTGFGSGLPMILSGLALILVGIAFKMGLAPFHMWVPDAYQGAPTPATGFMGSAVKLAAFGLAMRIFWETFAPFAMQWSQVLTCLAIITAFVGNLAALQQTNLKRLFAYSGISHAGYLALGIAAYNSATPAYSAMHYYLIVYGLMFLGIFGVLTLLEARGADLSLDSLNGMGFQQPVLGACLAVFALSAAGIPPTAGFFAKYFIFLEAVEAGKTFWVALAVISSLIGIYYYLRVLVHLYMKEPRGALKTVVVNRSAVFAICACALSLLYFAVFPGRLGL